MVFFYYIFMHYSGDYDMKFLGKHPWLVSLILIFVVVFPGFLRVEYINGKTDTIVKCVSDWADATSDRSGKVSAAVQERNDALDALMRSFTTQDRNTILDKLNKVVAASDNYVEVLRTNPLPISPRFSCF